MFGDRSVTLLTHRLGGRSWLRQRLAAAAGHLVAGNLVTVTGDHAAGDFAACDHAACDCGGLAVADYADAGRCEAHASVLVVRNPLSMLLEASAELRAGRPRAFSPEACVAELRSLWRSLRSQEGSCEGELRLPDFDGLAAQEPPLVVRIEDFVAFPAVTLRRIGEHIGRPPSRDLLQAFLRADRPMRPRGRPAVQPTSRHFDLFSWVDEVPPAVAAEVYAGCRRFVDDCYPEFAAVLREADHPAQRRVA